MGAHLCPGEGQAVQGAVGVWGLPTRRISYSFALACRLRTGTPAAEPAVLRFHREQGRSGILEGLISVVSALPRQSQLVL
jgi:hypothetical protein